MTCGTHTVVSGIITLRSLVVRGDLLVVPGAQKSASTTLSILLSRHPDVYRGVAKEPHFFTYDEKYELGLGYYEQSQYPEYGGQRYLLDASQSYLSLPFVPQRIFETLGREVRFIIMLRNPVDRMESAFKHFRELPEREVSREMRSIVPEKLESLTLDELLQYEEQEVSRALEDGRILGRHPTWTEHLFPYDYAHVGCYSKHIARYFEYFPRENFLFLTFEELTQHQASAMQRVAAFLGLSEESLVPSRPLHSSRIKRYKNEAIGRVMQFAKASLKSVVPASLKYRLADLERNYLLERNLYKFSPEVYNQLLNIFQPEIDRTSTITGLDLSRWKHPRGQKEAA